MLHYILPDIQRFSNIKTNISFICHNQKTFSQIQKINKTPFTKLSTISQQSLKNQQFLTFQHQSRNQQNKRKEKLYQNNSLFSQFPWTSFLTLIGADLSTFSLHLPLPNLVNSTRVWLTLFGSNSIINCKQGTFIKF